MIYILYLINGDLIFGEINTTSPALGESIMIRKPMIIYDLGNHKLNDMIKEYDDENSELPENIERMIKVADWASIFYGLSADFESTEYVTIQGNHIMLKAKANSQLEQVWMNLSQKDIDYNKNDIIVQ